jgi:WD40 repeat protein/serine/threonine protein kinase
MSPQLYVLTCKCGKNMTVDESAMGQTGRCPECGRDVVANAKTVVPMTVEHSPEAEMLLQARVGDDGVPVEWKPGDLIVNLYEVIDVLGEGGMGKVFKVYHRGWNMPLAVKSPKAKTLLRRDGATNFERECETWVGLGLHPNIVSCYYVRRLGGIPRVFAEFVDGGSLWEFIEDGHIYKGGLKKALERVCDIGIQMAWGLQHAHDRGLVHQDVKPANVLMTKNETAKVTDFGLARARDLAAGVADEHYVDDRVESVGMTRVYCSPEQANRDKLTPKTDIWSWALCILQAFTVKVIWRKGTEGPEILNQFLELSKANQRLLPMPPLVADLLQRCFRLDPDNRPKDMNEIALAMEEAYRGVTGTDYPRKRPKPATALADSLNNRGVSLLDLGKSTQAEHAWERALTTDPHHPESTYNLCMERWRAGRMTDDAVLSRLHEIAKFHPGEWLPQYMLALAHIEHGDFVPAQKALTTIEPHAPNQKEIGAMIAATRKYAPLTRTVIRTIEGHQDSITAAAISPDDSLILTGSADNTLRIWELATGGFVNTFAGHQNSVTCAVFSMDGTLALTGSRDRTVRLWGVSSGTCLRVLEGHRDTVEAVAIIAEDRKAISASSDGAIRVWDLATSQCLDIFDEHRGPVTALAADSAGLLAVSGGQDGGLRVWDVVNHRCTHAIEGHSASIVSITLSADGRFALTGGKDGVLKVWHPAAGQHVATCTGHQAPVLACAISADGRFAVSASRDQTVRFWDTSTGRCLNTFFGHSGPVTTVAIASDRRFVVSGGEDKTIRIWRTEAISEDLSSPALICQAVASEVALSTGRAFEEALRHARAAISQGNFLDAAKYIRIAREQPGHRRTPEAMHEWRSLYTRLPRVVFQGAWEEAGLTQQAGTLKLAYVTPNARHALIVDDENALILRDLARGEVVCEFDRETGAVMSACLSDDATRALTGGWDIKFWDAETGKLLQQFERQPEMVNSVDITKDLRYAASASGRAVKIWDVETGRCMGHFVGHTADVNVIRWSPDERLLLSAGEDKTLQIWELCTGKCLVTMTGHTQPIRCIAFSLDGHYACSGAGTIWGRSGEVKLWDLSTGACIRSFEGHGDTVQSVSISADSRYILSGSRDKTIRLWNLETGEHVHTFEGHSEGIEVVTLSRDGRFAASVCKEGAIRLWTLDWELEDRVPQEWAPGAMPYLLQFLVLRTPYGASAPEDGSDNQKRIRKALTRRGSPKLDDSDLGRLWHLLGCGGYGWLDYHGVKNALARTAGSWHIPAGLPVRPKGDSSGKSLFGRVFGGLGGSG